MIQKYLSLILFFGCFAFGFGQTKIAELNFETPLGYSTSVTEFTDTGRDYFLRTDGTDFNNGANGVLFNNIQGTYYFAAQDTNGVVATLPLFLNVQNIDISGYENLEFRVHLAEDDQVTNSGATTQHWDNLDYVHFNYDIDNTGLNNLLWVEGSGGSNTEPLIDSDFDGTGDGIAITDTFTQFTQNIPNTGSLLNLEIEFRLNGNNEDIAIDNIEIWGTLVPCSSSTTWTSTGWDNGLPDINTPAVIDFAYNTDDEGDIDACTLTVNNGVTLTVSNNHYINVKNEINALGSIIVEPQGSVIQKNDLGINSTSGNITVQKETSILNGPLEYTYWSSPVVGETIENVFANVPTSRRFRFDASNFEDLLAEVDNTGVFVSGQDDIDDNGDAWQYASGTMPPGVGYAATAVPFGPFPAPQQFNFVGPFNNGVVLVPLINNSGGSYNDWNFIGNPYPSAIDAADFFTTNAGVVDGAIYLWSQATPANANAQGNDGQNFSADDYAIISGSGINTAGGSGDTPSSFIPSGQGFFVEALSGTDVTFNNAMRTTGNNNEFYRSSNPLNRHVLWLNLNSDNGVYNQIAIAHIDGATDFDDGSFYDVKRNASSENYAKIHSIINGSDEEFIIQGKETSSLSIDEVIELGFSSIIESPTIYTISIAQFEGDFYANNDVFLKDNLLNTIHDLKASDYNFTSEVGEFNNRFEIVFNAEVLSTNENEIKPNQLTIVELANGKVEISLSHNNLTIENVEVLDMAGRQIYNVKANSSLEVFDFSNLSQSTYIARIALSNGQVISKKAIKQN